jgi:hypothetical protein
LADFINVGGHRALRFLRAVVDAGNFRAGGN